jgi:hypothetical protein
MATIDVCPACGYPTLGPDLCAFCRPLDGEWMPTPFDDVRMSCRGELQRLQVAETTPSRTDFPLAAQSAALPLTGAL